MAKRKFRRMNRRLDCQVIVSGSRYSGVVLNISPRGFFVQTDASPAVGAKIGVELTHRSGETLELEATVANKQKPRRDQLPIARAGIGCKLAVPPEEYYQLLGAHAGCYIRGRPTG